jgi:hypothetical protein
VWGLRGDGGWVVAADEEEKQEAFRWHTQLRRPSGQYGRRGLLLDRDGFSAPLTTQQTKHSGGHQKTDFAAHNRFDESGREIVPRDYRPVAGSLRKGGGGLAIGVCNSSAVPGYRSTHLSDLERIPLDHGVWRPIRRPLAITAFAVNAYSAEAGQPVIEPHDETSAGAGGHQEFYLVASGAATFTVAGEAIEAPAGTLVTIERGVMREAVATADATTIVVIGGRPDSALPPSPFEFWYAALPADRAGDLERAHEIVAEGLEHWPEHGTIHYVLGSLCARMGRRDEALRNLRFAFAQDPRTREWASDDEELDAVRDALVEDIGDERAG